MVASLQWPRWVALAGCVLAVGAALMTITHSSVPAVWMLTTTALVIGLNRLRVPGYWTSVRIALELGVISYACWWGYLHLFR